MAKIVSIFLFVFMLYCSSFAGELTSKEAENYYKEGLKLQKASNFVSADSFYQKTLLVDPSSQIWQVFILNNRGVMAAKEGYLEQAEMFFQKALNINPSFMPAKMNLGFIYEKRRSELESLKYWLKVLGIDLDKAKPKGYSLGEL